MTKKSALKKLRLGVLASHGGSNLQAIIDNCEAGRIAAEVCCVISNNKNATALERARRHHIPACHVCRSQFDSDEELDRAIVDILNQHKVDVVCLAGYMKIIGQQMTSRYRNRILNIHPALLPRFGGEGMYGRRVHEAVLKSGERESGPTIHLVDEIYDHGRILAQRKVPVLPTDTPETLAERVLKEEHRLYSETIDKIARGHINLDEYTGDTHE